MINKTKKSKAEYICPLNEGGTHMFTNHIKGNTFACFFCGKRTQIKGWKRYI